MSLTPREEHELYLTDRAAWASYAAPKWAQMLRHADAEEKKSLWGIAGEELRAELRALASTESHA